MRVTDIVNNLPQNSNIATLGGRLSFTVTNELESSQSSTVKVTALR